MHSKQPLNISEKKTNGKLGQQALLKFLSNLNNTAIEYIDELNHYYDSIIACMPNNVYWLDKDCVLQGGNDNLAEMFGLKSRKQLIGLTYKQMSRLANWTEGQGEAFRQVEIEVMTTGQPRFNVDEPPVIINGETRYYMSTKVPLYDTKKKVIGVIGISTDITNRKLAEEREKAIIAQAAEQKARAEAEVELRNAVTVLSGSIAHDLRTPILIVQMGSRPINKYFPILADAYHKAKEANLPLMENIPDKQLKRLASIGKKLGDISQEMQEFINVTLRTLSKALQGDLTQDDLANCSMWQCINSTLTSYPFLEHQRELVKWDRQDFDFMGNDILMIRVLSNLIKNSLEQISEKKLGEIFITTEKNDASNIIRFKDTAGGTSPEIVSHLFEAYRTTKEQGSGIGLAFCKLTMQSFGGDITCHSVQGDFIEFILRFSKVE